MIFCWCLCCYVLCDGVAMKYDDSHEDVDFICLFGQWEGGSYCRLAYSIVVIFHLLFVSSHLSSLLLSLSLLLLSFSNIPSPLCHCRWWWMMCIFDDVPMRMMMLSMMMVLFSICYFGNGKVASLPSCLFHRCDGKVSHCCSPISLLWYLIYFYYHLHTLCLYYYRYLNWHCHLATFHHCFIVGCDGEWFVCCGCGRWCDDNNEKLVVM